METQWACLYILFRHTHFSACSYRKLWLSKSVCVVNNNVTYGEACIFIHLGEDLKTFIDALLNGIKAKEEKKSYQQQRISLSNVNVFINTTDNTTPFFVVKSLEGTEIFGIFETTCAFKLISVLKDILPICAFIKEGDYDIVSAFEKCIKSCSVKHRSDFLILSPLKIDFIVDEIMQKDLSLRKYRIKCLLRVNRIDFCCLAKLHLCATQNEENSNEVIVQNTTCTPNTTCVQNKLTNVTTNSSNFCIASTSKQLQNGTCETFQNASLSKIQHTQLQTPIALQVNPQMLSFVPAQSPLQTPTLQYATISVLND